MPNYKIVEDETFSDAAIDSRMFGANFVTSYDFEFANDEKLVDLLSTLDIETLRFPGGSVTESLFADASFLTGDWSADVAADDRGILRQITPIGDLFDVAGEIGASVQLVLPTRVAFAESAGQALASGTYGSRTKLAAGYLDQVERYIDHAVAEARANGVEIARIELGNEFWGSGQMTAGEYGALSGRLIAFLDTEFPGLDVIAQVAASANEYSPAADRAVYLEPDGRGDFTIHMASDARGGLPNGWVAGTIPGSGSAAAQTRLIADGIDATRGAAAALDGIVGHVYFDAGFAGIDDQRDFALGDIQRIFADRLGLSDIDYYVTEWSPRNPLSSDKADNRGNANGLQYAQSTVEAFFELVSHGIDGANFWPMTFAAAGQTHRTLIDTGDGDLTFGGVAFQWLADSTLGHRALFDFEVGGRIDIHGFGDGEAMTVFAGERGGANGGNFVIDLGAFATESHYFATISRLGSDNGRATDDDADPVVTISGGSMVDAGAITLDLAAWELLRIELQPVGDGDDRVTGGAGNDRIEGFDGNDRISGGRGADTLLGGRGDDRLLGGDGNDVLAGGSGSDALAGGRGDDTIRSDGGADYLSGGSGDDFLLIASRDRLPDDVEAVNVSGRGQVGTGVALSLTDHFVFDTTVDGGSGRDVLRLSDASEILFLDDGVSEVHRDAPGASALRLRGIERIEARGGDDIVDLTSDRFAMRGDGLVVDGGSGDDTIWGTQADEEILGGSGDDVIFGGAGRDRVTGGTGADTFEFTRTSTGTTVTDFDASEGDMLRFYNRGGAIFDADTLRFVDGGIAVSYKDDRGASHDLMVRLTGDATDPFDSPADFLQSGVEFLF